MRAGPSQVAHRVGRAVVQPSVTMGAPAALALIGLLAFPIIYFFWLSLHSWDGGQTTQWSWVGLGNYAQALFRDPDFGRAFVVTVAFCSATVAGSLIFGTALGIFLNRPFRGRLIVIALLLIPIVSTPIAVAAQWLSMLQLNGLLNAIAVAIGVGSQTWLSESKALPTLIVIDILRWIPLVTLIILAGLTAMPTEPFEAARVDGAGGLRLTRYITLPLLRPFIAVAAVLRLIDAIKTFDEIQLITHGGPAGATRTLYLYAYQQGFTYFNFGYVSAILVLIFLGILLLSVTVIRLRGTTS